MPHKKRASPSHHDNLTGYSSSLMSDTKWRKLFTALDRPDLELRQAFVKFVDGDKEHLVNTPRQSALHPPRPYVDTIEFGPISLNSIEWIEFPAVAEYPNKSPNGMGRVPATALRQDVEKAEEILAALGRFPMEKTMRGLRVNGHVR